jgi:hypothetical protein
VDTLNLDGLVAVGVPLALVMRLTSVVMWLGGTT